MNASVSKPATINYYDTDPLSKERDQTGISIDLNHLSTWSLSQEYPNEVSDFSKKFRADTIVKITDISFNPISTPLDLRATPLPDPMSTEVGLHHQQSPQRSVFKMNPDFWQQARGPPALPAPPTNNGQQSTTPTGQQSTGVNSNPPTPNNSIAPNTPESKMMTDKLVNELQIFMHKSAMQLQARDLVPIGGHRSEVKPHQCQQCLKSFSSNHQLVQHIRVHTGEKPYKCSYCDRRFKQLSHVQQHTRLHTGERPYKCHLPECGRAFIQLSNLQQHLRNHDAQVERAKNRPFHCNICGKGFATESSLRTHTSKQHAALIGGPNATSCPICHKLFLGGEALMEHMKHTHKDPNASGVATKRRTANHPCPVCGKHYVNEGSLRKHLACHPETSQFTQSLRMWPCSVCQAVFTHESGLLSHMEHMRMDPKHQFAAQYVLSRAAAERRERESLLSAAIAQASSGGLGMGGGGGHSSMCASPSAHSDSSSGGGRLSSTGSEPGGLINNNNNNNNNKISELLARNNGIQQYGEDLHNASRMAAMAAIVGQSSGVGSGLGSPGSSLGVDQSTAQAVQQAAVNLAAAMRMGAQGLGGLHSPNGNHHQGNNQGNTSPQASSLNEVTAVQAQAAMNAAMRAASMADLRSMDVAMRSSMAVDSAMRLDTMNHHSSHQNHQNTEAAALRMHQAEALLRTQAEAALRLAVSQAAAVAATGGGGDMRHHNMSGGHGNNAGNSSNDELRDALRSPYRNQMALNHHNNQVSTDLSEALRLQEQRLEQALRLHGGDPRALGFSLSGSHSQQSQHQNN